MYLCHKCGGLLSHGKQENTEGLYACGCISGYVRDWQTSVDRSEALLVQIATKASLRKLYYQQGRSQREISYVLADIARLHAAALYEDYSSFAGYTPPDKPTFKGNWVRQMEEMAQIVRDEREAAKG